MKSCNKKESFIAIPTGKFEVANKNGIETVYKFKKSVEAICCAFKAATTFLRDYTVVKKSEEYLILGMSQRVKMAPKNNFTKFTKGGKGGKNNYTGRSSKSL